LNRNCEEWIALIRCGLTGEPMPSHPAWGTLYRLAVQHNMVGFLYRAMAADPDGVPQELRDRVRHGYAVAVGQQVQQDYYREQIVSALRERGIPYLPLKGEDLRALYPSPDLRFSCDIDFFYPRERRNEVNRILSELGFARGKDEVENDSFSLGAVHVEPHFSLAGQGERCAVYYSDIWERLKTDDGQRYRFRDEDGYLFLLLHMYKHMRGGGAGTRAVTDILLWNREHPDADRAYIAGEAEKLGMARFVPLMERLTRVWMGEEPGDGDTDLLTAYIVEGGAYGTPEQRAQMTVVQKGCGRRFSYLFRRVFPKYRAMRLRYPWLARAPWLLPFCYPLRWVQVLCSRDREKIARDWKVAAELTDDRMKQTERVRELIG